MAPYFKLVQYVLIAVLGSLGATLAAGGHLQGSDFANLAVVAVTAVAVYAKANTPDQPHAKAVVAVLGAAVAALTSAWTDHSINAVEVTQIVLAILGAIQVGTVANVPPGPQPEANKDVPGPAVTDVQDADYPYSAGAADTL